MSWTLIKQIEIEGEKETEFMKEVSVRTPDPITLQKLWTKEELEIEVQKIDAAIVELQDRKAVLVEQIPKFKPVEAIPK